MMVEAMVVRGPMVIMATVRASAVRVVVVMVARRGLVRC